MINIMRMFVSVYLSRNQLHLNKFPSLINLTQLSANISVQ